jgi:DNA-binding NarL/FixJ family response regulator
MELDLTQKDQQRAAPASVFVIATVRLYRDGISEALQRAGHEVCGAAADVHEALTLLPEAPSEVVLLDAVGSGGRNAVGALRRCAPGMRVVVLAISGAKSEVLGWAEAGVAGYVTRDDSLDDLIETVRAASRGEARCTPEVNAALLEHVHQIATGRRTSDAAAALTVREREIAECLGDGLSNKQIAAQLHIALPTVKNHVHNVLGKLEVRHRTDAGRALTAARH